MSAKKASWKTNSTTITMPKAAQYRQEASKDQMRHQ